MKLTNFVTVVQRVSITMEESLFALVEGLFAVETHMSMDERLGLLGLALNLPEHFLACEVGSYVGASTGFFGVAARLKNGHLHCVDTWDNRAMREEPPRDTYAEFLHNTESIRPFITAHRGESAALSGRVPDGLDILLIDGDHSYDAARADLFAYAPKLKSGGVLLLHDFDYPTVRQACDEYLIGRPVIDLGQTDTLKGFRMANALQPAVLNR